MDIKNSQLLQDIEGIDNHLINILHQAIETVRNQDISNYPILIAHSKEHEFEIGIILEVLHPSLDFRLSTLEELYVKNLILKDNLNEFRNLYLSKKDKICILGLTNSTQDFIFKSLIT